MKTKTLLPVYGEEKTSGTDFLKCRNLYFSVIDYISVRNEILKEG